MMSNPAKLTQPLSFTLSYSTTPEAVEDPCLILQAPDEDAGRLIDEMFTSMSRAAHDDGMHAVDWFVGVAKSKSKSSTRGGDGRVDKVQVTALWCALMILRGAVSRGGSARIAQWGARSVAEVWDGDPSSVFGEGERRNEGVEEGAGSGGGGGVQALKAVGHNKGLNPLTTLLGRPGLSPSRSAVGTRRLSPKRQCDF